MWIGGSLRRTMDDAHPNRIGAVAARPGGRRRWPAATSAPQLGQFTNHSRPRASLRGLGGLLELTVEALGVDVDLALD
jgi:hypothetical protein